MLTSLESAVSGLRSHQVRMDLIGNNLANTNTVGYKSQRLTFKESFSQMLEGSARPPGANGGKNPIQVGLGTAIGSIDTIQTQGNIQSTGIISDIAIEGKSYFAVSNGQGGTYYTRNGSFQLSSAGYMTLPTNGMVLQGKIADEKGEFPPGTKIGDIRVPFDEQSPAQATQKVNFARNLNADSMAKGAVLMTQAYYKEANVAVAAAPGVTAVASPNLIDLRNSKGESLGLKEGDVINFENGATKYSLTVTLNPNDPGLTPAAGATVPTTIKTLDDLIAVVNNTSVTGGAAGTANLSGGTISSWPTGVTITTPAPLATAKFASAFAVGTTNTTNQFFTPAVGSDEIKDLYDSTGKKLYDNSDVDGNNGLQQGDEIKIYASIGGSSVGGNSPLTFSRGPIPGDLTAPPATTLNDLATRIREELRLPLTDGTPDDKDSVEMNLVSDKGQDDNIIDGSIVVRGQAGKAFDITNLTIMAKNKDTNTTAPDRFNTNNSMTSFQKATDPGVVDTSLAIYDKTGATHNMTMTFVPTQNEGEWEWAASFPGKEEIQTGGKGKLTFGQDGSVSSFTYDDGSSRLTFDTGNAAGNMTVDLDMGGPGNFQGLTQFKAPSSASAISQDGYGTGKLSDISVDTYGNVKGIFTNGVTKNLAQIMLVDFANPGGLERVGDSVFTTSNNSGDPIYGVPGTQSNAKLRPGALEGSNVDISHEFTEMITTQRGFQANSRVITVSDQMLEELLGLKR